MKRKLNKRLLKSVLIFVLICFGQRIVAQPLDVIANPGITGQTFNTCNGILYASGGVSGTGYQNGENWIITICPDIPGDAVNLDFITFNLSNQNTATPPGNNADNFCIYDGNSTSATSLGCYGGTGLQGLVVSCTSFNTSGCITVEFHSNSAGTGNFAATITCTTPCTRPTAVLTAPIPVAPDTCFKLCVGESLTFNGSSSFAAPGFNVAQYEWNFDDGVIDTTTGPIITHAFNAEGEFLVDLFILDDNGCAATNQVTVQVLVGTEPLFDGTTTDTSICLGESVCLNGVVTGVLYTGTPGSVSTSSYLPDDVGQCFQSTITYNIFSPGQTITNVNQIIDICVTMEHSFMGDLVASVICPNGQSVILHQQGGGGTSLGEPIDINGPTDPMGVPYTYCWSENATLGTWADCSNFGITPNVMNLPPPNNFIQTLIPGTYSPLNSLSALVGCPLNGTWQLEFCDLWGSDDGWVTQWEVNIDPALMPDVTQFTPIYGPNCDSTSWSGINAAAAAQITSTSPDCNTICITPNALGAYTYEFSATDDFGCTYTTTTTVTVTPGPTVDAGADQIVCPYVATQLNATSVGAGTTCNYTFDLQDSFGDGWNGAFFDLFINGVYSATYTATGTGQVFTVPIPAGATFEIIYSPGTWESEVTYDIIDCSGNIVFSDGTFPAIGSVFTGLNGLNLVYSWTPTTGLSDPNISNPTASVSQQTTYYVTAYESGHPLCGYTDSLTLFIDPGVNAGMDGVITLCYNAVAEDLFLALGGIPALTGSWVDSIGNPISNLFDPVGLNPGTYTTTYIVPGNGTCLGDSADVVVTVLGPCDATCAQEGVVIQDASCNGVCDGIITVNQPGATLYSFDGGISFVPNNIATGLCAGTYNVMIDLGGTCIIPLTVIVNEPGLMTVNLTPTDASCFGSSDGSIITNVVGGNGPFTYLWDNGGTTAMISNLTAGNYCVTATASGGCFAIGCAIVAEPTALTMTFNSTNASCNGVCDGTATTVISGGTAPYSYNWFGLAGVSSTTANALCDGTYDLIVTDAQGCIVDSLDWVITEPVALTMTVTTVDETCFQVCDGTIDIVSNTGVLFSINGETQQAGTSFIDLCTGNYLVEAEDVNGCTITSSHTISGPADVIANFEFGPQPTTIMSTTISFENLSVGAISYLWDFGFAQSSDLNPTVVFPDDTAGTYNVCLYAYNAANCPDSVCFDVMIDEDFVIYVPNGFTPNGDGMNDVFYVYGNDIDPEIYDLMIFNRWGELIFQTDDLNTGWDGTVKGLKAPNDVYVWRLKTEAKSIEKYYDKVGSVTLVR
jgi:gliding motility-associated-like protein